MRHRRHEVRAYRKAGLHPLRIWGGAFHDTGERAASAAGGTYLVLGMRKHILEKSETRQNNRSFHMKREQKIAHFMKNTLFFEKMRNWHPNQSHCNASGSTICSLKHSLFLTLWCLGICILVFPRGFWMVVVIAC